MIIKDNVVVYSNDVQLTTEGAMGGKGLSAFIDPNTNLDTAQFVDQQMPGSYKAGELFYNNGDFTLTSRGLETLIERKKNNVRNSFNETIKTQEISGVEYHGEYDSILKMDGALRLAETAGLTEIKLYDTSNNGHVFSIADAKVLVGQLGEVYQQLFDIKQTKMVELESVDTSGVDATDSTGAVAQVEAINTSVSI